MANIDEISLSWGVFFPSRKNGMTATEALKQTIDADYRMIEFVTPPTVFDTLSSEVKEICASNIKVWAVHGILGSGAVSPEAKVRKQAIEDAFRFASMCADFCPCPLVEHYLDRHLNSEIGKYFRESIACLHEKVAPLGYTLCIETAPYKPEVNERYPDSREIADFVRSFDSNSLQMIVDFNHSNLNEDLFDVAKNSAGLVKSVHISNNRGERENHLIPNHPEGVIDIGKVFKKFRECGYSGACNLEFLFDDKTTDVPRLKKVREYMENLIK